MRIFVVGGTGRIGRCVADEAVERGHQVTAMSRHASKISGRAGLKPFECDVMDTSRLAEGMRGQDAIVVAYNNPPEDPQIGPKTIFAADSVLSAMRQADVSRVLWVGGAGSLFTKDGRRVVDAMEMPAWAVSAIWAMAAHYMHLQTITDLEWTFLSPPQGIAAGERTGKYRRGLDELIVDETGVSFISHMDFAIAVVDELEDPQHIRKRFTVGY